MPVTSMAYTDDDFVDEHDDFGDEEGDDDMSPEDKVAMAQGTAQVQQALGADAKVTVAQIQEALWHYYYDVDKSAAYLRRTFISPPPKAPPKKAPEGTLGDFSLFDTPGLFARATGADQEPATSSTRPAAYGDTQASHLVDPGHDIKRRRISLLSEFDDMPWLNVPQHRQVILLPPPRPRGGLLGGGEAPKMSKLQALAAARKKKTEEKKSQERAAQAESGMKRLSLAEAASKTEEPSPNPAKRQKNFETELPPQPQRTERASQTTQVERPGVGRGYDAPWRTLGADLGLPAADQVVIAQSPRSSPSAFAQTLCGSASESFRANRPDVFALPHASSPAFIAEAFSEPSPDDIVLAAQAKGSNFAKGKIMS